MCENCGNLNRLRKVTVQKWMLVKTQDWRDVYILSIYLTFNFSVKQNFQIMRNPMRPFTRLLLLQLLITLVVTRIHVSFFFSPNDPRTVVCVCHSIYSYTYTLSYFRNEKNEQKKRNYCKINFFVLEKLWFKI